MARIATWREAADGLRRDLEGVVGNRLRALVVYEAHGILGDQPGSSGTAGEADIRHEDLVHALAVVDDLGVDDFVRLAALASGWERRHLAVPLLLSPGDLARSFDAFPLEFSQILARHVLIMGEDPFAGATIERGDLRRACETQVRSHLLHLREGYLQTGGDPRKVAQLIEGSAVPLRALLVNIARLYDVHPRSADALLHFLEQHLAAASAGLRPVVLIGTRHDSLRGPDVAEILPRYLDSMEQLARLVDEWRV